MWQANCTVILPGISAVAGSKLSTVEPEINAPTACVCSTGVATTAPQNASVATVNVPDVRLEADEVLIKNFAENEGMVDALVAAGILVDTGEKVESGLWVEFPVCRLLVEERNG